MLLRHNTLPLFDRMRVTGGGHRFSTGSYDGDRISPAPLLGHSHASPYSCVVLAQPLTTPESAAAAAAAAAAAFVTPLTPPTFRSVPATGERETPPSPCCPPGCNCGVSSGSASSVGVCRVHEKLFSCPPPPPPVTSGPSDRESIHSLAGCDGEVAVPHNHEPEVWRQSRDDTSEENKEESVKELLLR